MNKSTSANIRRWTRLFAIAEVVVIFACVYGVALRIAWHYNVAANPHFMTAYSILLPMLRPMLYCFFVAALFLMFASPFCFRSLRSVAIRAWAIGAGSLLVAGFLCFAVL